MKNKLGMYAVLVALMITACAEGNKEPQLTGSDFVVTIKTDMGEMKAILYDETPKHKENFLKLVNEGFYDSLLFHRVINSFMIQGGDPESRGAAPDQRLGSGGPGYTVPAEFVDGLFHKKGALSAARQGDQVNPERASSGSQFYIVQGQVTPKEALGSGPNQQQMIAAFQECMRNHRDSELAQEYLKVLEENPGNNEAIEQKVTETVDQLSELTGMTIKSMSEAQMEAYSTIGGTPFLDDQYTVFGEVISGLEVIDAIATVATAPGDRPVEDVMMFMTVEEISKKEISEKYGYNYGK